MRDPLFVVITGTDTGVGKTWVTCALARELQHEGARVVAVKPIETGCNPSTADDEDGTRLARATGQTAPRQALERLSAPLAAAEALDRESRSLDFEALTERVRAAGRGADVVLIEGAGGVLAPLTWDRTIADLAVALGARAIVVAADRLGTINHARMTLEILRQAGVFVLAVVLDAPRARDESTGSNAAAIARYSGDTRVVEIARAMAEDGRSAALAPIAAELTELAGPRKEADRIP